MLHGLKRLLLAVAVAAMAVPAAAQLGGNDGEMFVKAIRDGNGSEALKLLEAKPTLANARNLSGKTALATAIETRNDDWTLYLLQRGADPNLQSGGDTPLITAARTGFADAAEWLLMVKARVDEPNRMGETPLIVAVQRRHVPIVRLLLNAGADPDRADSAAGYSARDYAKRDNRTPELLRLIEAKKPKR